MTGRADRWIRRTKIWCVTLLALIAGTVSYLHMHALVALHGQPRWVAALTPLSVDGMIVAASTTLLADSRSGGRGGLLPWVLLAVGSRASLAANAAVAEPTVTGRVIAACSAASTCPGSGRSRCGGSAGSAGTANGLAICAAPAGCAVLCQLLVFAFLDWTTHTPFDLGLFAGIAAAIALVGLPGPLWAQKRRRESARRSAPYSTGVQQRHGPSAAQDDHQREATSPDDR